jgi:hypothetical protein
MLIYSHRSGVTSYGLLFAFDRLRIIMPNGDVHFHYTNLVTGLENRFVEGRANGCTSRRTQRAALRACKRWSDNLGESFEFLGYL